PAELEQAPFPELEGTGYGSKRFLMILMSFSLVGSGERQTYLPVLSGLLYDDGQLLEGICCTRHEKD
ncbi:unnamed protein product, partial [Ilex paraguariensis]